MIVVWHFKRESVLIVVEPGAHLNKIACLSSERVMGVGPCLCRCYALDFQNKSAREDERKLIPMKVEKENTFTDLQIRRRQAFLISRENEIVILQDL